jgi:hypothetical protein
MGGEICTKPVIPFIPFILLSFEGETKTGGGRVWGQDLVSTAKVPHERDPSRCYSMTCFFSAKQLVWITDSELKRTSLQWLMASNDFQALDEPSLALFLTSSHLPPVSLQSNTTSLESCFMFASRRASLEESESVPGSFSSVFVERSNSRAHPPPPPYTPANHELRVPAALPKRMGSRMRNPLQRWATNRRSSGNNSSTSANSSAAASNLTTPPRPRLP